MEGVERGGTVLLVTGKKDSRGEEESLAAEHGRRTRKKGQRKIGSLKWENKVIVRWREVEERKKVEGFCLLGKEE